MAGKFDVSEDSAITIPLRNLIGLIVTAGIVVMGYFQLVERITFLERDLTLADQYIKQNSHFREKWPLGELGALPDDMIQNSKIQALEKVVEVNTEFRNNWAPPEEVQQSVKINNEQEIKIRYLETRIQLLESQLKDINRMEITQSRHESEIETQAEKIETLFDLWNNKNN
jgi:hypothetical protein